MIYLYSGTPGSGKSAHQARNIYYRLRLGKPVIANYAVNTANIKKCKGLFLEIDNAELSPERLISFSQEYFKEHKFKEGAIQLYIDEAQILFNARSWDMKGRANWIQFFTQHRKYGFDIYLVAQFDRMLDRQLRSLIEYEVIHRKVSNFGAKGMVLSLFALGNLFVAVKVWYPMNEKVSSEFFRVSRRFTCLYDSYSDFDAGKKSRNVLQPSS